MCAPPPNTFSILGRNYTTPFCQDDTENERCAIEIVLKINDQELDSDCKKSCSHIAYFGEIDQQKLYFSDEESIWNMYFLWYELTDQDFEFQLLVERGHCTQQGCGSGTKGGHRICY